MGNGDENYPLNSSLPTLQLIFTSFKFQSFLIKLSKLLTIQVPIYYTIL